MSVPEAAVYEDGRMVRPHHDVGFARHALHIEPVAVAMMPQPSPHLQLRLGGLAANVRHALVPLLGCHRVGHRIF